MALRALIRRGEFRQEIVLAAVQQNVHALQFAARKLKGDAAIVQKAVEHCGHALRHAAEELKGDRAI
eukprot:2035481-Amphidinium_carterae.1